MQVEDVIAQCDDGKPRRRDFESVTKLIVHRIGGELGKDAIEIAKSFQDTRRFKAGAYTDGNMPYHFIITRHGRVQQALTLGDHAPHAKRFNSTGLAVALIGDFRVYPPSFEQYEALKRFAGFWRLYGLEVHGHTELHGASSDPNKACPGHLLNMQKLRADADEVAAELARGMLEFQGVSFRGTTHE
tara:strand:+ start:1762 stop:2322 length:561 start_codon:yes stop_codon:yes gene_type:complete